MTTDMALEMLVSEQAQHYREAPPERKVGVDEETIELIERIYPQTSEEYGYFAGLYAKETGR